MKMKEETGGKLCLSAAMLIFGSIGLFVRYLSLPSAWIATVRGGVGTVFLLLVVLFSRKKLSGKAIRSNLPLLLISGAAIGFNWVLLFESYRYTTVATATVCYYMAPVIVMILSPLLLSEHLNGGKIVCIVLALAGMLLVSGVLKDKPSAGQGKGILFGLAAAALYASVMLMNQKMKEIPAYDKTILQLGTAAVVVGVYSFFSQKAEFSSLSGKQIVLLLTVGIIHTGVAYWLYFASMGKLSGTTVALYSYIDPAFAMLLSIIVLREKTGILELIGAILILGATLAGEFIPASKKQK